LPTFYLQLAVESSGRAEECMAIGRDGNVLRKATNSKERELL